MDRNLYVVYASDDCFVEILGVSLTSLYENNKCMDQITVFILGTEISDANKKKIESIGETYNRGKIQWINAKDISKELEMDVSVDRGSMSQYARLFISSSLPENIERVLYLDCDTIIKQPLDELWNLDLHGKTIAALMDAFSKFYRKNINLEPNDIMFNSGVMLIDLTQWRENKVEEKLLNFIKGKRGKIQQGDQGALNAVLSHDVICFNPKFNAVTIFFDFSYKEMMTYRKPPEFYSEEHIEEAVEYPVIIHFTSSFLSYRPWHEGCEHRYVGDWLYYKGMSPWGNDDLWKSNHSSKMKDLYVKMSRFLPRTIFVKISGFLQAYGRPIYFSLSKRN